MCNLQKWNSLTLPSIMIFFRVDFCLFKPFCQSYCLTSRGLQQCKLWDFETYYVGERPLLVMSENYSSCSEKRWSLIKNDQCWAAAIFASASPPWPRKDSLMALYFWMSFQRMWHVSSSKAVECSIYTIWLLPYRVWVCVRCMLNLVHNGWQVPSKFWGPVIRSCELVVSFFVFHLCIQLFPLFALETIWMQTILCVVTVTAVFQLCLTTIGNWFAWQMLGPRDEVYPGRKKSLDVVWWSILPFCPIACPYSLKFHSLNSLFSMLRIGASLYRQSTIFKVKLDFGTDRALEVWVFPALFNSGLAGIVYSTPCYGGTDAEMLRIAGNGSSSCAIVWLHSCYCADCSL